MAGSFENIPGVKKVSGSNILDSTVQEVNNAAAQIDLTTPIKNQIDTVNDYINAIMAKIAEVPDAFNNNIAKLQQISDIQIQIKPEISKDDLERKVGEVRNILSSVNTDLKLFDTSKSNAEIQEIIRLLQEFRKATAPDGSKSIVEQLGEHLPTLINLITSATSAQQGLKEANKAPTDTTYTGNLVSEMEKIANSQYLFAVIDKDIKALNDSFGSGQKDLVTYFELFKNIDNIASQAFPNLHTQLGNMQNATKLLGGVLGTEQSTLAQHPESVFAQYNQYIEQYTRGLQDYQKLMDNMAGEFKKVEDKMFSSFSQGSNKVVGNYQNDLNFASKLNETILAQALANRAVHSETPDSKFNQENEKLIEAILNNQKNIEEKLKQSFDKKSEIDTAKFSELSQRSQVGGSDYATMMNMALGTGNINQFQYEVERSGSNAQKIHTTANRVLLDAASGIYGSKELKGIDSAMNMEEVAKKSEDLARLVESFNKSKELVMTKIKDALKNEDQEGLENAKRELKELLKLTQDIGSQTVGLGNLVKIYDKNELDKAPDDVKRIVSLINDQVKNSGNLVHDYMEVREMLPDEELEEDKNKIKELNNELANTKNSLDEISAKSKTWTQSLKDGIGDFFSPLGSLDKLSRMIGIGSLPFTLSGLSGVIRGAGTDYKMQGMMEVNSMLSEFGMGNAVDQTSATRRATSDAQYYFGLSNGLIGFEDYNKFYNNLAKNVGGQYGASDTQSLKDLQALTSQEFIGSKLYGISEGTMNQFNQTFFKDLRMNAEDVAYSFTKMTQTATSANIPVEKYVQTVTQLAAQYQRIGIDGDRARQVMDDLLQQGLTAEQAQMMTSSQGTAMQRFASSGQNAFWGMMSGQFSNPFQATYYAMDRYDENGKLRDPEGWANSIATSMNKALSTMGDLSGGDPNIRGMNVQKELLKMGFDEMSADIGASAFLKGDDVFKQFLKENDPAKKQEEVANSNKELAEKMAASADQMAMTQKIEADLALKTYQLATIYHPVMDSANALRSSIDKLTDTMLGVAKGGAGLLEGAADGPLGDIANAALEHPLLTLGGLYVGKKAVGGAVKGATSQAKKGLSGIWDNIWGKGGKAAQEAAEHVGDDALEGMAKATGGSADNILSKLAGKGGKLAAVAALIGGGAWVGSKLFGDGAEEIEASGSSSSSATGDRLYNKVNDIYNLMATGGSGYGAYGANPNTGYGSYSPMSPASLQGAYFNQEFTGTDIDAQVEIADAYDNATGSNLFGQIAASGAAGYGATKLIPKLALDKAGRTALKGAGSLTKTGLKVTAKEAVPGLAADFAFNAADYLGHAAAGDLVGEDFARTSVGFATDASMSALGAAIGTAILPGIGTAIGAVAMPVLAELTGVSGGVKSGVTKGLTGMSLDDIEYKRALVNDPRGSAMQQLQMMGVGKEYSQIMVEALEKHADKLQKMSEEEKYAWTVTYANYRQNGLTDKEATQATDQTDKAVKQEIIDATVKAIIEAAKAQGVNMDESDAKRIMGENVKNADNIVDIQKFKNDAIQRNLAEILDANKTGALRSLSGEEIIKASFDNNNPLHDLADKMVKQFYNQAYKEAEYETDKYTGTVVKEEKKTQKQTDEQLKKINDDAAQSLKVLLSDGNVVKGMLDKEISHTTDEAEKNNLENALHYVKFKKDILEGYEDNIRSKGKHWYESDEKFEARVKSDAQKQMDRDYRDEQGTINKYQQQWEKDIYSDIGGGSLASLDSLRGVVKNNADYGSANGLVYKIYSSLSELDKAGKMNINDKAFESVLNKQVLDGPDNKLKQGQDKQIEQYEHLLTIQDRMGNDISKMANGGGFGGSASGYSAPYTGTNAPYSGKYSAEINNAAQKYGVDAKLLAAMIQQESGFDADATNSIGARGLMQLMPGTAIDRGLKVDTNWAKSYKNAQGKDRYKDWTNDASIDERLDPAKNIEAGASYIAEQLKNYNGNVKEALAAYNAGPGKVKVGGGVPKITETEDYVHKVLGYYNNFSTGAAQQQSYSMGSNVGMNMVAIAQSKVGKAPYVWGAEGLDDWDGDGNGTSVDKRGIRHNTNVEAYDCSGLVSYAAHMAGVSVGRLGATDLYKKCTPLSRAELPGDLGFLQDKDDPSRMSHVGLYAGNGKWIEASSGQGGVVERSNNSWTHFGRLPGVNGGTGSTDQMIAGISSSSSGTGAQPSDPNNAFGLGKMVMGVMSPSAYSSYFNNDPESMLNQGAILLDLLEKGGAKETVSYDWQKTYARTRYQSDAMYKPTEAKISENAGVISSNQTSNANNYTVKFDISKDAKNDPDGAKLYNAIKTVAEEYGARITVVENNVEEISQSIGYIQDNIHRDRQ